MRINNKDPWEWTESELQSLIDNETPEAVTLEYKGSDSLDKADRKKREISKDISAMANSNGGVVIYGIRTHPEEGRKHLPQDFDKGVDPSQISIEWLEQVSDSNIQPRINGLRFCPVELTRTQPCKFAYLVYVPKSNCAHQAADKRYHGRIERTTLALEDYQIRDINNRSKHPILTPHFKLSTVGTGGGEVAYNFEIELENTGTVRARDWAFEVAIPNDIRNISSGTEGVTLIQRGHARSWIRIDRPNAQQVIFPQDRQRVYIARTVRITEKYFHILAERAVLSWRIYADDAPLRCGETKFLSIELNGEEIAEKI